MIKTAKKSKAALWSWQTWQFLYIFSSLSWLLAPSLDRHLSAHYTLISQFEDPGRPWAWLFRIFDILAALLLGAAAYKIAKDAKEPGWHLYVTLALLGIIAAGSLIDDLFPSWCRSAATLSCLVPNHISRSIHLCESTITGAAFLALNCWYIYLKKPWARYVLAVQLAGIGVIFSDAHGHLLSPTLLQFAYEIALVLWLATIVPPLQHARSAVRAQWQGATAKFFGGWLFASGLISIIGAIAHLKEESRFNALYLGNAAAWLSQHGIVTGIILMYISRHLWRGEYRAWQIAQVLLWFQTLKYAVLTPDYSLVLLFGLSAIVLFITRPYFNRWTSVEQLSERLKRLALVVVATIVAILIGIVILEYRHTHNLGAVRIDLANLFRHLLLLDIDNSSGPLRFKLVGQAANTAGFALLLAVLVSLFKPKKFTLPRAMHHGESDTLEFLRKHSQSSEDYFKYWPHKAYWQSTGGAVIAYSVVGTVAFALADPLAPSAALRRAAAEEYLAYCRQNGWRACFLMVNDNQRELYASAEYKLFRIGASAVVDIQQFSDVTSRNKWWRWVHNKATRQNLTYRVHEPPHSPQLLSKAKRVSDEWLKVGGHQERGFAMGYFDENYLQQCRLHVLYDGDKLVAFANELPVYNKLKAATIDLMRYGPDESHAMPVLLSAVIKQLQHENNKTTFDLGFVPLAVPEGKAERATSRLGQLLMGETMSARGLEQFKNKFAPQWQDNYIAFDGDWADLLHIGRWLSKLLEVK